VDPFDSFQIVLDIIGKQYEGMPMGFLLSAFIVGSSSGMRFDDDSSDRE